MKEIVRQINIPKDKADAINKLLSAEPRTEGECFGEDDTITYTAKFDDGIEMDIKLCGVQYDEGGCNTPWTEAVLFQDGCEVCHSDVDDEFFGIWELEYKGINYMVNVVAEGGEDE